MPAARSPSPNPMPRKRGGSLLTPGLVVCGLAFPFSRLYPTRQELGDALRDTTTVQFGLESLSLPEGPIKRLVPLLPLLLLGLYVLLILRPLHAAAAKLFTRADVEEQADTHHSRLDLLLERANLLLLLVLAALLVGHSLDEQGWMAAGYAAARSGVSWLCGHANAASSGHLENILNDLSVPAYVQAAAARSIDLSRPYFNESSPLFDLQMALNKTVLYFKENGRGGAGSVSDSVLLALGWEPAEDEKNGGVRRAIVHAIDEGLPLAVGVILLLHGDVELPRVIFLAGAITGLVVAGNIVPTSLKIGHDLAMNAENLAGTVGSTTIASGAVVKSFWELYRIYGLSGLSWLPRPESEQAASPFSARGAAI
eukprot:SAG31_NODE_8166_length_1504_cov_1.064723_1_plen_368_part_10